MSLTSRVFGLFSTTATSDPTLTSDLPTSKATQTSILNHEINAGGAARHAGDEAALEEEPRPPYLHVRSLMGEHPQWLEKKLTRPQLNRQCWLVEPEDRAATC